MLDFKNLEEKTIDLYDEGKFSIKEADDKLKINYLNWNPYF